MSDLLKTKGFVAKNLKLILIAAIVIVGSLVSWWVIFSKDSSFEANKPTVAINKNFDIKGRLKSGKATTGNLKLKVVNAQITDSMLVQGKVARPIKGKLFLLINMEIENPHKVALYAFPKDLFRFERADGQKFAPSAHQGTVEIRPIATKKSNVAFVIEPNQKQFKILIGELGNQQTIQITFK